MDKQRQDEIDKLYKKEQALWEKDGDLRYMERKLEEQQDNFEVLYRKGENSLWEAMLDYPSTSLFEQLHQENIHYAGQIIDGFEANLADIRRKKRANDEAIDDIYHKRQRLLMEDEDNGN